VVHGGFLLNHDGDDDVPQCLDVFGGAAITHEGVATHGDAVEAVILWGVRAGDADALSHVVGGTGIGEQDAAEAGADASLGHEGLVALVNLDHHAHVVELGGAAEVIKVMEVKGGVFGDELNVVVEAGVPKGLNDGGPGGVNVGADGGLASLELLTEPVGSHDRASIVCGV